MDFQATTSGEALDAPQTTSGEALDTPQTSKQAEGPKNPPPAKKNKRPCGAEIKRRRKAKEAAALAAASSARPAPAPHAPKTKGVGRPKPQGKGQTQPSVAGKGNKRIRSATSTPSPSNTGKRPCMQTAAPKTSYAQAANSHLRIAIINKRAEFGLLTAEQASEVERQLMAALDKTLFAPGSSSSNPPSFSGLRYAGKTLRITCDDEESLKWLNTATSDVSIADAELAAIQVADLPRLTKLSLWIPGQPEDKEKVLARLGAQNRNLKVASWCCFHTAPKDEPLGQLLVMGIGEADAAKLATMGGKLKYFFSTLSAKVAKSATKETAMECENGGDGDSAA